jgi:hypothetical protein
MNRHLLSLRHKVFHPVTRVQVTLLGPCFKTGRKGGRLAHWRSASRTEHYLRRAPPQARHQQVDATLHGSSRSDNAASATIGNVHKAKPQLSDFTKLSHRVTSTLSGFTPAISRSLELSLQSPLQLSLTVLVCYRIHVNI